ncbi:hypothetical protein ACT3SY_17785 [Brachybacterium sp. AOP42-E1-35]|uniref:hypothetical protein n=1 Tax=Brachybacterium sp. AOP42-E1-35 TaxID=3457664 RepID=UPI00402A8761
MPRFEPLPHPRTIQKPVYRHPETRWRNVAAFLSEPSHSDGIHVIGGGPTRQIELMIGGDPFAATSGPVTVIFSGAVTVRKSKTPPFFSGSGLAAIIGHPYIAISDPSLEVSDTMAIAWYVGNSIHDTARGLAKLLTPLSDRLGKELWLVGGSAGGFAALNLAHLLPGRPSVFVWNPQTDIVEYSRNFVTAYLTQAFPVPAASLRGSDYKTVARTALRYFGRRHTVLEDLPSQGPGRMIYLQNASDGHMRDHCVPYLRAQGYAAHSPGIWYRDPERIVWTADFAPGHTPPSREQLISLLTRFTTTRFDVLSEVLELDGTPGYADDPQLRPDNHVLVRELSA